MSLVFRTEAPSALTVVVPSADRAARWLTWRLQTFATCFIITLPLGHRRQQVEQFVPLAVDLGPCHLDHESIRVEVEHAHVGLGPVLNMMHQGIESNLEQVVAGLACRCELLVDDPMVRGAPIIEHIIEDPGDTDRFPLWSNLESHIDPSPSVAKELPENFLCGFAAVAGISDDVREFAHVNPDSADKCLLLGDGSESQGIEIDTVEVQELAQPSLDGSRF